MRIIFLDFDGPIIPLMSHQNKRGILEKAWPPCVAALNRITNETGAKIVVSSTWRADGITKTRGWLKQWGVKAKVIGITPHLREKSNGSLICIQKPRGLEIAKWMEDYEREPIESFVILDDDKDMEHLMPFLIHTPFEVGLTEADADKAIQMLDNPKHLYIRNPRENVKIEGFL